MADQAEAKALEVVEVAVTPGSSLTLKCATPIMDATPYTGGTTIMDIVLIVNFGSTKTGLNTVGYQLKNAAGTNTGSRVTAGVYETSGGGYGANVAIPYVIATGGGSILWDTGEATPKYASEEINPQALKEVGDDVIGAREDIYSIETNLGIVDTKVMDILAANRTDGVVVASRRKTG